MKKYLEHFYAFLGVFNFLFWYLCLFPIYVILISRKEWHIYTKRINQIFGNLIFWCIGIPIIKYSKGFYHISGNQYIFVANHTSYLDVPLISATSPVTTIFMGKKSLAKIPLFGYMYKRLHIPFDRKSPHDIHTSLQKARDVLSRKMSLGIFAEGGIRTSNPPHLAPFKEGAFILAIEQKIPIVPVVLLDNWYIFWNLSFRLKWKPARIIYCTPIQTQHLTLQDAEALKQQTWDIIQTEIEKEYGTLKKDN
ncbi:MAG: 1-acyl-sn-glycerol-3-phosphate acyltransferase [Cytophagales bacterium]|nr:1-acyl-sn-glycerol-3-phosphate acyltransferase [Cytophagales bacterium]MDW8383883.1 lysophospholipid acyltransferase family protein [Flammeovirgaceae bacterium]